MAIITRNEFDRIMRNVMDSAEITESMTNDISRLRSDFDERETILSRYGTVQNADNLTEYEYAETPGEDWETKFHNLEKEYKNRFFGDANTGIPQDETILTGTESPVNEDKSIDELFE